MAASAGSSDASAETL